MRKALFAVLFIYGAMLVTTTSCRKENQVDSKLNALSLLNDSLPTDSLPGDTIPYPPHDTFPFPPHDTFPYPPHDTFPFPPHDTFPYPPHDTFPGHHPGDTLYL